MNIRNLLCEKCLPKVRKAERLYQKERRKKLKVEKKLVKRIKKHDQNNS
jgi:hypothetical protein